MSRVAQNASRSVRARFFFCCAAIQSVVAAATFFLFMLAPRYFCESVSQIDCLSINCRKLSQYLLTNFPAGGVWPRSLIVRSETLLSVVLLCCRDELLGVHVLVFLVCEDRK